MKKIALFLLMISCLTLIGCSKDAEINAFLTEWEAVTNEMSQKLETGNIDEARKAFDAKKESLKSKWNDIKGARGFQVSQDTKTKMEESMKKNMSTLTSAVMKGSMKATDKSDGEKMKALMTEYTDIFKS